MRIHIKQKDGGLDQSAAFSLVSRLRLTSPGRALCQKRGCRGRRFWRPSDPCTGAGIRQYQQGRMGGWNCRHLHWARKVLKYICNLSIDNGRQVHKMTYLAHISQDDRKQTVLEHLNGTAELSGKFAAAFGAEDQGRLAGLVHDLGKYSAAFQRRIQGSQEQRATTMRTKLSAAA